MGVTCCVAGCKNRFQKGSGINFFRIPKKPESKRQEWILAINRVEKKGSTKLWEPSQYCRICSEHFETGEPNTDKQHVDYRPTKNMGYKKKETRVNGKRAMRTTVSNQHLEQQLQQMKAEICLETDVPVDVSPAPIKKFQNKETQTMNDVSMTIEVLKAKLRSAEMEVLIVQRQREVANRRAQLLQQHIDAMKFTVLL